MKKKLSILFSSAGRRVALINCFREDAKALGISLRVICVDKNPSLSAACSIADASYTVPACSHSDFIESVLKIAEKEQVKLIVPLIDTELPYYSNFRDNFRAKGIDIMVSECAFIEATKDKLKTQQLFERLSIKTPKIFSDTNQIAFPVILKPQFGSNSKGVYVPKSQTALSDFLENQEIPYLIQSYIQGQEFTVHMLVQNGVLKSCIAYERIEVRAGEVSKARIISLSIVDEIAEKLASIQQINGVICFQGILDDQNQFYAIEINARFGGGFPLVYQAGGQYPKWLMEKSLELKSSATRQFNSEKLMLRYDEAIYL